MLNAECRMRKVRKRSHLLLVVHRLASCVQRFRKYGGTMEQRVKSVIDGLHERLKREAEEFNSGQPIDLDRFALAAGPETAGFLNLLIRSMGAKRIVEVRTSIG